MNVTIRPLQEDDAKVSYVWRNDQDVWKFTGSRPDKLITVDDEITWIKRAITDHDSRRFAIVADGTYIGNIYLTDITARDAQYHIFIGDKAYWGKGIATMASKELLSFAKETLPIEEIYLEVKEANNAAVAVYEKLGFQTTSRQNGVIRMAIALRSKG